MTNAKRLSEKDPAETVPLCWDFTEDLDGATIVGIPNVTIEVDQSLYRGKDPNVTAMINGVPQVSGKSVYQSITGGVDRVDYKVRCVITTSGTPPSTLQKTSILPVRVQ